MPETPTYNQEPTQPTTADQLVGEAVEAFNAKDAQGLDAALLKLGAELGVELETAHEEALKLSQAVYDKWFGDTKYKDYNFKKEYAAGNLGLFDRAQEKEAKPTKENYSFQLFFPNHIPREEFLEIFNQKYGQEYRSQVSQDGVGVWYSDQAKADKDQTKASQVPPGQGYILGLRPQNNTLEAHPETVNLNLVQQKAHLLELQNQHPDLNLRGLTLPEYLFADACFFQTQGKHLDENGWSYLLEEENSQTGRALCAGWGPGVRRVLVDSVSGAGPSLGARFAAVSRILVPLNP
jgi:hypothetical protein